MIFAVSNNFGSSESVSVQSPLCNSVLFMSKPEASCQFCLDTEGLVQIDVWLVVMLLVDRWFSV